jgi:hypothetical protein
LLSAHTVTHEQRHGAGLAASAGNGFASGSREPGQHSPLTACAGSTAFAAAFATAFATALAGSTAFAALAGSTAFAALAGSTAFAALAGSSRKPRPVRLPVAMLLQLRRAREGQAASGAKTALARRFLEACRITMLPPS